MVAWLYHLVAILLLSIGCLSLGFGFGKSKSFIMEQRHSIESQEDIRQVLEDVFSASLLEQPRKVWENRMGFSGASVMEVDCNWESKATELPSRVFVKNILLEPPAYGANEEAVYKWRRNRQSYLNEIHFLAHFAPELTKAGYRIPKVYKVLHQGKFEGSGEDAESFLFISESMTGNEQIIEVADNPGHVSSTLEWLAGMHAIYFGQHSEALAESETETESVWREGTHLALSKRPPKELENLSKNWEAFCDAFNWPGFGGLGARVAAIAPKIATHLSPVALQKAIDGNQECDRHRLAMRRFTLVHGDAKPANLFYKEEEDGGTGTVAFFIDFQWAGWGVGATDIIYFLATALGDKQINTLNLEAEVLQPYYSMLTSKYSSLHDGKTLEYSYKEFELDFKVSCVDYVRWIMACRLPGETPETYAKRRQEMDPNLGAYRRSEPMMLFLLSKVDEYLPDLEATLQ